MAAAPESREAELQDTIMRLTNQLRSCERRVRALERDLEHASADAIKAMAEDVSYCKHALTALCAERGIEARRLT